MILSKRFAISQEQAEHLAENLQKEVEEQTQALRIKTVEAQNVAEEAERLR